MNLGVESRLELAKSDVAGGRKMKAFTVSWLPGTQLARCAGNASAILLPMNHRPQEVGGF